MTQQEANSFIDQLRASQPIDMLDEDYAQMVFTGKYVPEGTGIPEIEKYLMYRTKIHTRLQELYGKDES